LKSKTSIKLSKYKPGDRLNVKIEKIVPNGYGLSFAEGLTVFTGLAAAGDELVVEIRQLKHNTAFAEIVEVVTPSLDRVEAPCVYFGACGGCDFQQLNYQAQLDAKLAIIRDSLTRIGKLERYPDIEMVPSPQQFDYRLRAQWHVNRPDKKIGYYRRNSHDLVDIERCLVLAPELEDLLENTRRTLDWDAIWSDKTQIDAALGDDGSVSLFSPEFSQNAPSVSYSAYGERFFYSAQSFFQGNRFLINELIKRAVGGGEGKNALDLYSGVGLFTLPLARHFKKVIGVEDNDQAVDFAEKNAEAAGLENVDFVRRSVRHYLNEKLPENTDFLLLDPPRAGAENDTIQNILKIGAKQISYVSCEPSILARDLRKFLEGGYLIDSITALDLFPQTHHVETVVRLSRK
jgi:23S rRNA (uracil1939-C5)-methyltransferase